MLLASSYLHHEPFAYFTCADALPTTLLNRLDALYGAPLVWQHHTDSFYRAYLCDVSAHLDAGFCKELSARMRVLVGMPLTNAVRATLQRMEPGQYALPHTDRPLVGYEAARLVVQLNRDWRSEDGGQLSIHPDERGKQTVVSYSPRWNTAFGFAMGPRSFHSVRLVTALRRTVVLNFWHAGNTAALATWISAQFNGMRFDFSGTLGQLADHTEPQVPEEDSFRAGCVAYLLLRWGFSEGEACSGYQAGLQPLTGPEGSASVLLARWVARLWRHDFDPTLWQRLAPRFTTQRDPRLEEGLRITFPLM